MCCVLVAICWWWTFYPALLHVLYMYATQVALNKIFCFATSRVFESQVAGKICAEVCGAAARVDPASTLKKFLPFCITTIERLLEGERNSRHFSLSIITLGFVTIVCCNNLVLVACGVTWYQIYTCKNLVHFALSCFEQIEYIICRSWPIGVGESGHRTALDSTASFQCKFTLQSISYIVY